MVTKLSQVDTHNDKTSGFGVSLSCYSCMNMTTVERDKINHLNSHMISQVRCTCLGWREGERELRENSFGYRKGTRLGGWPTRWPFPYGSGIPCEYGGGGVQVHRETDRLFVTSGVHLTQFDRGHFHFRVTAFSSQFKSCVTKILTKVAVYILHLT